VKKVLSVMLLVAVAVGAHIGGYALDGWLWECLKEDGTQFTVGAAVLITAIRTYVLFVVLLATTRAPSRVMHACWRGGGIGVLSLTALYAVYSPAPFALASLASALVFFTAALWPRRWLAMRQARTDRRPQRTRDVTLGVQGTVPACHANDVNVERLAIDIFEAYARHSEGCPREVACRWASAWLAGVRANNLAVTAMPRCYAAAERLARAD
jgi:hypothetical protein